MTRSSLKQKKQKEGSQPWLADLTKAVEGEVAISGKWVKEYSTDASIFRIPPQAVVFPRDSRDLSRLVTFVGRNKHKYPELSLTARAAGTDMTGGPLSDSIVVGSTKYQKNFSLSGNILIVEPGAYYRDVEPALDKEGLMFPSYPASKSLCAWGGIVNNNSGGEKSLRYGKTARYVKEMSMILDDGREYTFGPLHKEALTKKLALKGREGDIYRGVWKILQEHKTIIAHARPHVTKNSAGYALWDVWDGETFDMTKVLVSAQGTLGMMTSAKIQLVKKPRFEKLAVIFLSELAPLPKIVNALLPLGCDALEVFDDNTMKLAIRFFPQIARKVPGENLFTLAWKFLPEALIGIQMLGIPKLIILAAIAEETEEEAEAKLSKVDLALSSFRVHRRMVHNPLDAEKYWVMRRESFSLLRENVSGKRTAPFVDDFIIAPDHLPEALPRIYAILKRYGIKVTLAGHAGSGNFHIIPLMDLGQKSERDKIPLVSKEVYDVVLEYGGSTTGEHNDGLVRGAYLEQMFGKEVYQCFRALEHLFDPRDIFNPGKKVNVDFKRALSRIDPKPKV